MTQQERIKTAAVAAAKSARELKDAILSDVDGSIEDGSTAYIGGITIVAIKSLDLAVESTKALQ